MNKSTKLSAGFAAMACVFLLGACDDDDVNVGDGGVDARVDGAGNGGPDANGDAAAALSLYERLGGQSGLEMFVKSVVETRILTDAELRTFFFNQMMNPIPAGHPSAKQITVCFARFVGARLGAQTYPGPSVNDLANENTPNHVCRDMVESHKGPTTMLRIGSGNFDKFVGHIAASLEPLIKPAATQVGEITQAEFNALAAALVAEKPAITTEGAPSTGPFTP